MMILFSDYEWVLLEISMGYPDDFFWDVVSTFSLLEVNLANDEDVNRITEIKKAL